MRRLFVYAAGPVILLLLLGILSGCGSGNGASVSTQPATTPEGNPVLSNVQLSDTAPGLGTIMIEVAQRNWVQYYAATGGNWDLAAYQNKEIGEAMDVGQITRPKRADALETFIKGPLDDLNKAIAAKDTAQFQQKWSAEVAACNSCHASQGFNYIQWNLPKTPPEDYMLTAP